MNRTRLANIMRTMAVAVTLIVLLGVVDPALAQRAPKRDREIEQAIQEIRSPDTAKRIAAAGRLKELADKGKPVARRLCEMAVDRQPKIREAALEALAKVSSSLAPPVTSVVRLLEKDRADVASGVFDDLVKLGDEAAPATPVVIALISRDLKLEERGGNSVPALKALAAIAHLDQDAMRVLIAAATPAPYRTSGHVRASRTAMESVGRIAVRHPETRKQLIPVLIAGLRETKAPMVLGDSLAVLSLQALAELGPDAKPALPYVRKLSQTEGTKFDYWVQQVLNNAEK